MKKHISRGLADIRNGEFTALPGRVSRYFIRKIPRLKNYLSLQRTNLQIEKLLLVNKKYKAKLENISIVYILSDANAKFVLNSIFTLRKEVIAPHVVFVDLGNNSDVLKSIKNYLPKAEILTMSSSSRLIEIINELLKINSLREYILFTNELAKFNSMGNLLDKIILSEDKNYCLDFIYNHGYLSNFYINRKKINFYENMNLFRAYFPLVAKSRLKNIDFENWFKQDFEVLPAGLSIRRLNEDFFSKNLFRDIFVRKYEYIKLDERKEIIEYAFDFNKKVSIIILTKDKVDLLDRCIKSIEKSSYKNYEIIIVDHDSNEESQEYFGTLPYKVIKYSGEFNFSKMNNTAAKKAVGDILCFLNNDIEVISENWIEVLGGFADREDIGIVGAKLLFKNHSVQHAGMRINKNFTSSSHISTYEKDNKISPELSLISTPDALSGACMFVSKDKFLKVKGFNENYTVIWQDVDLCLEMEKTGFKNLFIPYIKLYHLEASTRKKHHSEKEKDDLRVFMRKWR
jgi:GT2 family glycosyltransferase